MVDTVLPPALPFCFLSSPSFSILSVSLDWSASFSVGFPWEHCHAPLFSRGVIFTLSVPLPALPLADFPSLFPPLSFSPHPAVSGSHLPSLTLPLCAVFLDRGDLDLVAWGLERGMTNPIPQEKKTQTACLLGIHHKS